LRKDFDGELSGHLPIKEENMKRVMQGVLLGAVVLSVSSVFASEIKELVAGGSASAKQQVVNRVLCIDGLKVFQTTVFGGDDGTGAAVSNIQLYDEENGKVVPVLCYSDKSSAMK
jgi:hypothetical protein